MPENRHLDNLRGLAEKHGWPGWCASLYYDALNGRAGTAFEDSRIHGLAYAGFAAAVEIDLLSQRQTVGFVELLDRLTGKIEIRQWIRELLQNALDVREEERRLRIALTLDEDSLTWTHNGRGFCGPRSAAERRGEMDALIEPGLTTKKARFAEEGRFGVGFKAWSTFFRSVEVACVANGEQVTVGWSLDTERLAAGRMAYSEVEAGQEPETRFRFEGCRPGHQPTQVGVLELREELSNMLLTWAAPVTIVIRVGSEDHCIEHSCEREPLGAQGERPRKWRLRIHHEVSGEGAGAAEHVLAVQTEIYRGGQSSGAIEQAVEQLIEVSRARFEQSETPPERNPWANVTVEDWFDAARLTVGVIQSRSPGDELSYWLHSLAPIERASGWPTGQLRSRGTWHINGPFFIHTDRLELNNDRSEENTALLAYALRHCARPLAEAAVEHDPGTTAHLCRDTPFDPLIENPFRDRWGTPYHFLIWKAGEQGAVLQSYVEVFPDGFLVDRSGQVIEPDDVRRIPSAYRLAEGESAKSLISWLNEREPYTRCSDWCDIPWDLAADPPRLLSDGDAPLLRLVSRVDNVELYRRLDGAGFLDELIDDHPGVVHQEWFSPPVPEGATALVLNGQPPASTLVGSLWGLCESAGVRSVSDAQIAQAYGQRTTAGWEEIRGIPVVSQQEDATERWWVDRLVEVLGRLDALTELDIQKIAPHLNAANADWFAASGELWGPQTCTKNEPQPCSVLVRRDFSRPSWSLATETLTAWTKKKGARGETRRGTLWRGPDASREQINDLVGHDNVIVPQGILINRPLALLAGEPVNPGKLLSLLKERMREDLTPGAVAGQLLVVRPDPTSPELIDEIRRSSWSLLPKLLLTRWDDDLVSHTGELGASRQWYTLPENMAAIDNAHRTGLYGHVLMLHGDFPSVSPRYAALLREVDVERYCRSCEATSLELPEGLLALVSSVNSSRLCQAEGVRLELVAVLKRSGPAQYELRRASVRRFGDKLPDHKDRAQWFQPDEDAFQGFRDCQLAGFTVGQAGLSPWLPQCDSDLSALFNDRSGPAEFVVLDKDDLSVNEPLETEARKALANGLGVLLDRFVAQPAEGGDLVVALARYLERLGRPFADAADPEPALRGLFMNLQIDRSTREALEDATTQRLRTATSDEKRVLELLNGGLQMVREHSWETLVPILREFEDPADGWQFFLEQRLVPPSSAYRYRSRDDAFHLSPRTNRQKPSMIFIGRRDAQRLLRLGVQQAQTEYAGAWTIPEETGPLVLLPDESASMLDAEAARGRRLGRWSPEKFVAKLPPTVVDNGFLEPGPWCFAQVLIGLWIRSRQSDTPPLHIPAVVDGDRSQPCEIFDPEGPVVTLGTRGWDLRWPSGRAELVTALPGPAHSLSKGSLRVLLEGLGLGAVIHKSLRHDRDVKEVAIFLGLDAGQAGDEVERLRQFDELWNPWHEKEDEKWTSLHLRGPDLHLELRRCLEAPGARSLLDEYVDALTGLLRRGEAGPNPNHDLQEQALSMGIGALEDVMYPGIESVVADEPIVQVPGEEGPLHRYKHQRHSSMESPELHAASLQYFPGNILLLSPFTQRRAQRRVGAGGLVPSVDRRVQDAVAGLLDSGRWGDASTTHVVLRDVMEIGAERTSVSLRVHKLHAVLMCALDDALEQVGGQRDE